MFRIDFRTSLFSDPANRPHDEAALNALMEGLVAVDVAYLVAHPQTALLYDTGVRYKEEPPGQEIWADIGHVLHSGSGDCDDLVGWRVAELRARGIDKNARGKFVAYPRVCQVAEGAPCTTYHVVVQRSDGRVEDPSIRLGMRIAA